MQRRWSKQRNIAVLIDANDASVFDARALLRRTASFGTLCIKRAYADWLNPAMHPQGAVFNLMGVQTLPCVHPAPTQRACHMALMIDAMDILYAGHMDAIFLCSSDGVFAPLAMRLREHGMPVFGFGSKYTPSGFVAACDRFIFNDPIGLNAEAAAVAATSIMADAAAAATASSLASAMAMD